MEKIAIISDIHGNITALNAVLADIEKLGILEYLKRNRLVNKAVSFPFFLFFY